MQQRDRAQLALAMVGLPARGKTYIARKVTRYLAWLGFKTRLFNVGSYRREHLGSYQPSSFFDPENSAGRDALLRMAMSALEDVEGFFGEGGEVALYDATNSTRLRRALVAERFAKAGVPLVFVESICSDPTLIEANVRETKLRSPDYANMTPDEAVRDFKARIAHYERAYEPVDEPDQSWIKIIDVGRQLVLNRVQGYLPARLAPLFLSMHLTPRPIWLTRHGESEYNERKLIGGDADLGEKGRMFSERLANFVRERSAGGRIEVWTSSLRRTLQTASPLTHKPQVWRALDEVDAGVCDGMTYEQIKQQMPEEYAARAMNKFTYRYPRGESYEDLIKRLEPVVIELERQRFPVLVIAHQAVVRALYAYLMNVPPEGSPHIEIPLHTVIELTPNAYGCDERRFPLGPAAQSAESA
jgi:broad specificity phosphatase PhoE/predicted kinase